MKQTRKSRIARRFDNAAAQYDQHSHIQRQAAEGLAQRVLLAQPPPSPLSLEIGCGTGHLTQLLVESLSDAYWLITDLAPNMVQTCRDRVPMRIDLSYAVMDGEQLAASSSTFDLICTNLAVQWFEELSKGITELTRALRPGGLLAITTLGQDTFREWRNIHLALGLSSPTVDYPSAATLASSFPTEGHLVIEEETILEPHANALSFARSIRAIGAHTPRADHKPLSTSEFRKLIAAANCQSPFPARYHVLYALYRKTAC